MKEVLQTILITAMILLSANTFAQTQNPQSGETEKPKKITNTYFDIMVNGVSTNLNYGGSNDGLEDFKKETKGIQAGVSFQAGITPSFSIVTEFYFMMKGGKLKADNPLTKSEITQRLYSLELPVLARLHLGKFHANAGPSIAYNLSGTRKINGASTDIAFKNSSNDFKRFEAGVQIGGGYTFRIKEKRIALDMRYNYGLTNISRSQDIHNRSFVVSIHTSPRWKNNPFSK
ncbi:MAG: PorT family protein [Sphingobacteriaceae bacterium]|nr:PorT family protein [Sphingobacteriaceae bacterium]